MTKEQEREELHLTIWQIANDLRGSVDGWDLGVSVQKATPLYLEDTPPRIWNAALALNQPDLLPTFCQRSL